MALSMDEADISPHAEGLSHLAGLLQHSHEVIVSDRHYNISHHPSVTSSAVSIGDWYGLYQSGSAIVPSGSFRFGKVGPVIPK